MKIGYCIVASIIFISACKNEQVDNTDAAQLKSIDYSFYSEIMDEERSYTVYSPLNSGGEENKQLPVLFILDGPTYFSYFKALLEQWSNKNEIVLPEMVIVSIKQENRSSEFLPSYMNNKGNGDAFLLYLEKELIPAIERDYSVLTNRTLFGHSRGGLFGLNVLLQAPDLFENFIISDPSLTLGDQTFIKKWNEEKTKLENYQKSLFIGLADTKEGYTLDYVLDIDSDAYPHMRVIWSFCTELEKDSMNNKHFQWKYYEGFGHNTIPAMVAMDGLLSVFDYHRLDKYGLIYSHLNEVISYDEFKETIIAHFDEISLRMGSTVLPFEELIFEYGEIFLEEDMNEKAMEMFEWNVDNFPKSVQSKKMLEEYSISQ